MDISIHDNFVISYEVLCEKREIRLHTVYRDGKIAEYTDVIFRGVEAYYLRHDNFQTIIFDIDEIPTENILSDESELFKAGRKWGWPGIWNDSDATLRAHMLNRQVRGFSLNSSFGMCGWVLAQSMEKIRLDSPDSAVPNT